MSLKIVESHQPLHVASEVPRIRVAIDRGGTFTDIYAEADFLEHGDDLKSTTKEYVIKLLSVDPQNYVDAPTEGIRRILEIVTGQSLPKDARVDTTNIEWIRMGTTVATNALLERDGEPCALVATQGLRDMLAIGNQSRPSIFDLKVKKMPSLYSAAVEAEERVRIDGSVLSPPSLVVHRPLNEELLRKNLLEILDQGISSLAVALMHSYAFHAHEQKVRDIATELGFTHISLSGDLTPMVKIIPRGFTATVDAYLTPKIREYLRTFRAGFRNDLRGVDVQFMQSDGGLCNISTFSGYLAILSGPAGGVVGYARSLHGHERFLPEVGRTTPPMPIIGFDMGGTSTDVSRYAGHLEHVFETETAGVTIQAPQLDINTVAAGGGSRLFYRNQMFYVGPESAGAHPGPVCYRKGGHLTVTDANVMLGRIVPDLFPHIFGENADQPLDVEATRAAFKRLTDHINNQLRSNGEDEMSPEDVADGFIKVANEAMCRPIRQLTEAKGYDARDHTLACFGGAGGQHACAIARSLSIENVFVHKYAGILSAYGIALAESVVEVQEPAQLLYYDPTAQARALELLSGLKEKAMYILSSRSMRPVSMQFELYLNLRYEGTDFGIMVRCPTPMNERLAEVDFDKLFVREYTREHGFSIPDREIVIDDVRVRVLGSSQSSSSTANLLNGDVVFPDITFSDEGEVRPVYGSASPFMKSKCYYGENGGWVEADVWRTLDLPHGGTVLPGPCLIIDTDAGVTIVVDPGCVARLGSDGNVVISLFKDETSGFIRRGDSSHSNFVDHVQLSIYAHRFMGIAEQMGRTLQRTAISTNIKERLDFSCALFDNTGGLVANAPHVPVHLGAMQDAVRYQVRSLGASWEEGEVLLSNHPTAGGTHLPDMTIITPVYHERRIVFYVASRGHHADIGGATPGSMPPFSTQLSQEGLAVRSFKIVTGGDFQENTVRSMLADAGCRCIRDVLSDLRAQVAANQKGITLVKELIGEQTLDAVLSYMGHIQNAADQAVRSTLKQIARTHRLERHNSICFSDHMDDGTEIKLQLSIDEEEGTAVFDFRGSGPEVEGNTNAPRAITSSAVIYALRCLVDQDIPLNQGCLSPVSIRLPPQSILSPSDSAAVVGGNVLTSQRITDVILGAFGVCAASQGCMNNFTFGDDSMGYYETIAGGAGAGPSWNGTSGVQVHMTNTRMTDPEILERRYPAVLREFSIRRGSGGAGDFHGGDGVVRELEFTKALTVSILSERRIFAPWGLKGGQDGKKGLNELIRAGQQPECVGGKSSFSVKKGDIVRVSTPGGGGFGGSETVSPQ